MSRSALHVCRPWRVSSQGGHTEERPDRGGVGSRPTVKEPRASAPSWTISHSEGLANALPSILLPERQGSWSPPGVPPRSQIWNDLSRKIMTRMDDSPLRT